MFHWPGWLLTALAVGKTPAPAVVERLPGKRTLASTKACGQAGPDDSIQARRIVEASKEVPQPDRYHAGLPPVPIRWILIQDPEKRFDPQALVCTDLQQSPLLIVPWFVRRWQVEVTFQEVRRTLGVETQRQWSQPAIARTTTCLLALFSLVTLLADQLARQGALPLPQDTWHNKSQPTFADALAAVRQHYWRHIGFRVSPCKEQRQKLSSILHECPTYAFCRAA